MEFNDEIRSNMSLAADKDNITKWTRYYFVSPLKGAIRVFGSSKF